MNKKVKQVLKSSLISGIIYAGIIAGLDYADGLDFRIWRFIINCSLFTLFMGFATRNSFKN